jgi:hypothetical protein
MRTLAVWMGLVVLAGCAGSAPESAAPAPARAPKADAVSAPGGFSRWVCDGQTEVQWRFTDAARSSIDLRAAGDDIMHRLQLLPVSAGTSYSDGRLAFDIREQAGRLYLLPSGKNIDQGCKAL